MSPTPNSTTLCFYTIAVLILCFNLLFLWMASAVARSKEKTSPNPEDTGKNGVVLSEMDPPKTARILRAHANAQAVIYPFLFLGIAYVFIGGNPVAAGITFGLFCVARWLHTFCYMGAKQPFRTLTFLFSLLTLVALMIEIVIAMMAR